MSFKKEKRDKICNYILEKIKERKTNIVPSIATQCSISETTVRRYLAQLENDDIIKRADTPSGYKLVVFQEKTETLSPKSVTLEEDRIYSSFLEPLVKDLPDNIKAIWCYAFNEIMNNAIEHADADTIAIHFSRTFLSTTVLILDDGVGIFNKIKSFLSERDRIEATIDDAVTALFAGKLTTDSKGHSGEGIFFTSRVLDSFIIVSSHHFFTHDRYDKEGLLDILSLNQTKTLDLLANHKGTIVQMELWNNSKRELAEVFDMFSTVEKGFFKTQIPVKNAITSGFPVSRSQARRLCEGFSKFEIVELDFNGIDYIGQAFAHEIFIVYKKRHPETEIIVTHASKEVSDMIARVENTTL